MGSSKTAPEELEIVFEFVEGEEAEEIERLAKEQKRKIEAEKQRKRERRAEINREIAAREKQRKKENDPQLGLFDDL
jgi:hypothetical protein